MRCPECNEQINNVFLTCGCTAAPPTDEAMSPPKAVKHDQAKPDLSLLPREFVEGVALAFQYGEKKYGRHNFRQGMEWHRPAAALLRHAFKWLSGEDCDDESGLNHLFHVGACVAMLIVYQTNNVGTDTRFKK